MIAQDEHVRCPPVLICGFNRPTCLRVVLDAVKRAAPVKLFLALDYPREGISDDVLGYNACKKLFDEIDWASEIYRNYAEKNLGCGERMQSAITWTFQHVDRAIILEDDCVPHQDFFRFCSELLERYKDDSRVGMIAGHDEHLHLDRIEMYGDSYYFDRMTTIWGWATWRRAWEKYDSEMTDWPFFVETRILKHIFPRKYHVADWISYSGRLYRKERKTWAGKWAMTMYREHWLSVHPCRNLISNIGSGISSRSCESRTKMKTLKESPWQDRPTRGIKFPLKHPKTMIPNTLSEYWHLEDVHSRHWWKHIPTSIPDFCIKWQHLMKRFSR